MWPGTRNLTLAGLCLIPCGAAVTAASATTPSMNRAVHTLGPSITSSLPKSSLDLRDRSGQISKNTATDDWICAYSQSKKRYAYGCAKHHVCVNSTDESTDYSPNNRFDCCKKPEKGKSIDPYLCYYWTWEIFGGELFADWTCGKGRCTEKKYPHCWGVSVANEGPGFAAWVCAATGTTILLSPRTGLPRISTGKRGLPPATTTTTVQTPDTTKPISIINPGLYTGAANPQQSPSSRGTALKMCCNQRMRLGCGFICVLLAINF